MLKLIVLYIKCKYMKNLQYSYSLAKIFNKNFI